MEDLGVASSSTMAVDTGIQSMGSHPVKIDVTKFDGKGNFGMWRCEVMDALCSLNLEDVLDSDECPNGMSEKTWLKMNRNACGLIRNCLSQEIKYGVMLETSAGNLWRTLESKYLAKSVENRLHMKRRLYRFQMRRGVSIDVHLNDFTKLLADLLNLDEDVGDEDKALLLLNSLPDEYENFTMSLIHGKDVLKYSEVATALLNHEFRRRDKESSKADSAEALMTHRGRSEKKKNWQKKNSNSSQKRGKSRGRSLGRNQCAFCLEIGHWKKDCPKLKEKAKGGSSGANAHITQEIACPGDFDDVSLSVISHCLFTGDSCWILDTGATFHICPNREWFCTYKSLDSGAVTMGNNQTCRTVGVGSILVRMHDGAVRELTDVRHVPEIKKNLLSVGALEAKGYKIIIEAGVLKISRGALVVMRGV